MRVSASEASAQEYQVKHWTSEQGLPQNSARALLQTRDSYLWIGTLNGLARFDGKQFKVFSHDNTPEMLGDSINNMVEDEKDGSLWIATSNGVLRYHEHRFERYGKEQGIEGGPPVFASHEGGVWYQAERGRLGLIRDGRIRTWSFANDEGGYRLLNVLEERSSSLTVLKPDGVFQLDLEKETLTYLDRPAQLECFSLLKNTDGSLLLADYKGIWLKKDMNWILLARTDSTPFVHPSGFYRTPEGQVWVRVHGRDSDQLFRIVEDRLVLFNPPGFPQDVRIDDLLQDREGNLWLGTNLGLFRLRLKSLQVYSRQDKMRNDETLAVAAGPEGGIYVGTALGVTVIQEGRVANLQLANTNYLHVSERIPTLLPDRQRRLWIPAAIYENSTWGSIPEPVRSAPWQCRTLHEDRQGRVWATSGTEGVFSYEAGQWTQRAKTNDLSHSDVRVIYQDRRGDMWFGTFGGGLNRLHDGKFTSYATALGEYNNRAWWIHEDADGIFWVGSQNGLNRFVPPGVEDLSGRASAIENRQLKITRAFSRRLLRIGMKAASSPSR